MRRKPRNSCAFSHTSPALMVNPCACSHNNFDNEHSALSARPVAPANASRMLGGKSSSSAAPRWSNHAKARCRAAPYSSTTTPVSAIPVMPMPMHCVPVVSTSSATRSMKSRVKRSTSISVSPPARTSQQVTTLASPTLRPFSAKAAAFMLVVPTSTPTTTLSRLIGPHPPLRLLQPGGGFHRIRVRSDSYR